MSVKLYIKDNTNGMIHEYGTNPHDCLELQSDGSIHYFNLQDSCGTQYAEEGYSFCLVDGSDPRENDDYMESVLDIGGDYHERTAKAKEEVTR